MTRTTGITALSLAALALGAGATVGSTDSTSHKSLRLVLRLPEAQVTQVDAPPAHSAAAPEDSPGDAVVLHAPVRRSAGAKAGQLDAVFTATARGDREQVVGTFTVGGDQISVQGIDGPAETDRVAITGGTGRYAGARGTVTSRSKGPERRFYFVFVRRGPA
jgi:hypothetical protein